MTPKTLICAPCKRAGAGRIECRLCGRRGCKHFLANITDGEGQQYDPLRDPRPDRLLGTCGPCKIERRNNLRRES